MSRVALLPGLNTDEKTLVLRWLNQVLPTPRLAASGAYPLAEGRISVYVDGSAKMIRAGQWQWDGYRIYVGQGVDTTYVNLTDRLAILAGIISAANLWTELTDAYSTALSRTLLETYNGMMGGLVASRGSGVVNGLAFHNARRLVAARFAGEEGYFQPNGEPVDVSGEGWVMVEGEVAA